MQTPSEVGKYVTDGKMVYPYNAFLDDMIKNGSLQYCGKPEGVALSPKPVFRTPITYTPEERLDLAQKLGITLGELTNMSGPEFEEALKQIETGTVVKPPVAAVDDGFPS
jgi:hypothetical protein